MSDTLQGHIADQLAGDAPRIVIELGVLAGVGVLIGVGVKIMVRLARHIWHYVPEERDPYEGKSLADQLNIAAGRGELGERGTWSSLGRDGSKGAQFGSYGDTSGSSLPHETLDRYKK